MKYMLLIYGNEENFSSIAPAEFDEIVRETDALNRALLESGELIGAYGVADEVNALFVRVRDGATAVTERATASASAGTGESARSMISVQPAPTGSATPPVPSRVSTRRTGVIGV